MGRLFTTPFYNIICFSQKLKVTGNRRNVGRPAGYPLKAQPGFKCENPVKTSESAHKLIRAVWDEGKLNVREQLMALFISSDKQTVGYHATFMRTVDRTYGNPRYILILALHTLASSVIIVHNHPSGSLDPSPADIALTGQIKNALDLIEVKLVDHLIINEETYLSMSDQGLM